MARSRIIAGKAVIIIEAQDLVNKTLGKIRGNLHRFSNEVGKIGEGLFRTGFFGAIGSGLVVNSFIKFDDAMRTLQVNLDLFGKSAQQVELVMKPLEERIRSLAKITPFNPTEVAGAATELAKGDFNPKQIIDSLQAVLDLSRATNTELGVSAKFVVDTMTTFGIGTEQASEVVSQLVRAARKGTLGIEDLQAALTYASGTADVLGVSLQKMLAIFTVLSKRGLTGSIAGTSTNTALAQLVKKAQELEEIGEIKLLTGIRADGREAIDVITTLERLFKYAETLPFEKQQVLFQDIFNLRGARSISGMSKEMENIKHLTGFIADAGDEAAQAAKIMDEGIGGAFRQLVATIQDVNIELGKITEQPFIKISAVIKGLVAELGKVAALNPELTSLVILSPGILLAAGAGMFVLAKGLRLAAYSAGALKGALGPIGRLLSKGTVGQITALSQLRRATPSGIGAITGAIGSAKNTVVSKVSSASANLAARREATRARRALLASNQRNAVLALKREADATKLITAAQRNQTSAKTKLASSIKQINVAQARNTSLLANNAQKIKAAQKAAKLQAVQYHAAIEAEKAAARASISYALAERQKAIMVERVTAAQRNMTNLTVAVQNAERKWTTARSRDLNNPFNRESLKRAGEARVALRNRLAATQALANSSFETPALSRAAAEKTIKRNAKLLATLNARTGTGPVAFATDLLKQRSVLLAKQTKLERVGTALTKGKVAIEGRYVRQLTKGQDVLLSANKAKQAIQAIDLPRKNPINVLGGIKSGLSAAKGFSFATITKGLVTFGSVFKTVFTGIRKLFSTTGLLTVLEVLILFGDKIPIVKDALAGLGQGFSNAFKQIGDIAKYATGPLALIRASIDAFVADRSDLGVQGLLFAFSSLASIIGNQLSAAWNKFKEAISPVYDFVVGLFTVVDTTIRSIVESISTALGSTISTFSKVTELFSGQGVGDLGNGFLSGVRNVAEAIAKLIPSLFNWISQFSITFNEVSQKFLVGLEYTLNSLNPTTSQKSAEDTRTAQLGTIANETRLRRKNLADDLKATLEGISQAFNTSSAETSRTNANKAISNSLLKTRESFVRAAQIMQQLQRTPALAGPQLNPQAFQQQITPQNNPLNVASVQNMKLIAEALVGSAQSTSRNLLKTGKPLEQKQLEEQEKTNEILEKIARERGIQFAP